MYAFRHLAQLFTLVTLVSLGQLSMGQANRAELRGTVEDAVGRPLAGARRPYFVHIEKRPLDWLSAVDTGLGKALA